MRINELWLPISLRPSVFLSACLFALTVETIWTKFGGSLDPEDPEISTLSKIIPHHLVTSTGVLSLQ